MHYPANKEADKLMAKLITTSGGPASLAHSHHQAPDPGLPELHGPESRVLARILGEIRDTWNRWNLYPEVLETTTHPSPAMEDVGDPEYQSMPPHRSRSVQVRYHLRGRGKPLPYSLDDE